MNFSSGYKNNGALGYYDLLGWWHSNFNSEEKKYILEKYVPLGGLGLLSGQMSYTTISDVGFLTGFQTWFNSVDDYMISEKILTKAESIVSSETPVLDIHFLYGACVDHYYRLREIDSRYYDLSKKYCLKQIEISDRTKAAFQMEFRGAPLPRHRGYDQLIVIYEREKMISEALQLSKRAQAEGWRHDWDKRIARLEKKLEI